MGQEIVYCFKCSSRVVVGDAAKPTSYTIGGRVACAECAAALLTTLPEAEREELLSRMHKTAQGKPKPPSKRTPSRGTEAVPPSPPPNRGILIAAAAGVGVVLIALIAAMSGSTPPRVPESVAPPPDRRPGRPVVDVPAPKESYEAELARIDASVAGVNRQEGFKEALDYLASARKRHEEPVWTLSIDRMISRSTAEIQALYASLENKALDARRRGAESEVKEITDRVGRWNLPDRAASLKKTLEAVVASVFKQGADGIVCIEAEHFTAQTEASGHSWTGVQLPAGFEGEGAMAALPNDGGQWLTGYASNSSRMDFKVDFVKTGVHYVWIRGSGDSDKDNSVHLGLNAQAVPTVSEISWSATKKFVWTNKQMNGKNATLTVATAGVHTINLWMREDGAVIDRVVITSDSKWGPKGNGPPESPR